MPGNADAAADFTANLQSLLAVMRNRGDVSPDRLDPHLAIGLAMAIDGAAEEGGEMGPLVDALAQADSPLRRAGDAIYREEQRLLLSSERRGEPREAMLAYGLVVNALARASTN